MIANARTEEIEAVVVEVVEEAFVENVEAIVVIEEAEEGETLIVDYRVETRDRHLRQCNCSVQKHTR